MTTQELFKRCVKESGIKQGDIARQMGICDGTLSNKFKSNIQMDAFLEIMDILGYDVIVHKRDVYYKVTKE